MSTPRHLPATGRSADHEAARSGPTAVEEPKIVVPPDPDPTADAEPPVVVPSAEVRAVVRFGVPPAAAPEDLAAFVVPEHGDWVLTDDVLAFGEPDVLERFDAWRAGWERTWVLDPRSNVIRLLDIGRAAGDPEIETLIRLTLPGDGADELVIPRHLVARSRAGAHRLAELARARDAMGHGLVDLTPNTRRTGLARAWPACGEVEVVAALHGTRVLLDPAHGLVLHRPDAAAHGPIDAVHGDADGWTVESGARTVRLDHAQARPLAWLVPGATAWRHRRVPEIVTWTRTLVGLDECLAFASAEHLDVRLTTRRPVQLA